VKVESFSTVYWPSTYLYYQTFENFFTCETTAGNCDVIVNKKFEPCLVLLLDEGSG
jgi:hypothetical protein